MQEKKFIEVKEKQQQKAKITYGDIIYILSLVIGLFITTELFQIGFYIKCNTIQTILIYAINAPAFAYVIFKTCFFVLIKSVKNSIKRG